MMTRLHQLSLFLILAILISVGCTKSHEDQPPSNLDGVSDGRGDNPDQSQPPPHTPSAPQGEVRSNEYTIQVGIFDRPEAAEQLAYELRAQRINNFVQQTGNRWRVCVGRFYSRGRAERTMKILHERGFTKATVIPPES